MLALIFGGGVIAVKKLGAVKHNCLLLCLCQGWLVVLTEPNKGQILQTSKADRRV